MREAWTLFASEITAETLQALQKDGAVLLPHWVDGEFVGAGLLWGTEIHYAAHPSWRKGRLAKRGLIREFLRPHFEELGFLTTRVQKTSKFEHDFVTRLGFKQLPTEDDVFRFYMLTELPFTGKIMDPCSTPTSTAVPTQTPYFTLEKDLENALEANSAERGGARWYQRLVGTP